MNYVMPKVRQGLSLKMNPQLSRDNACKEKEKTEQDRCREVVSESDKYVCDQCQNTYNHKSDLTRHIQSKHEGIKYGCEQCDFQANDKSALTKHPANII